MKVRTRWQASGMHLTISLLIAAAVLALMLEIWYPAPLFQAAGADKLLFTLVGVDVTLGPLITLVIYKHGKPGLKLDLTVIAILQLGAFAYGAHVVALARPAFIVFVKDRFELAAPADLEPQELARARFAQFRSPPWSGPLLAAADMPADPAERARLVSAALAGLDLQNFPRYWVPYAERRSAVLENAQTPAKLRETDPATAKIVDAWLAESHTPESSVRYLALRAKRAWVAVLVDAQTARPVKMLLAETT